MHMVIIKKEVLLIHLSMLSPRGVSGYLRESDCEACPLEKFEAVCSVQPTFACLRVEILILFTKCVVLRMGTLPFLKKKKKRVQIPTPCLTPSTPSPPNSDWCIIVNFNDMYSTV